MSKKSSGLFVGTKGAPVPAMEIGRGVDYNSAGPKDVKMVNAINVIDEACRSKVPTKGEPNSVTKLIRNGAINRERYYDHCGDVYLDIDYTNHNNAVAHPVVPHQHKWTKNECGEAERKKWEKINNE